MISTGSVQVDAMISTEALSRCWLYPSVYYDLYAGSVQEFTMISTRLYPSVSLYRFYPSVYYYLYGEPKFAPWKFLLQKNFVFSSNVESGNPCWRDRLSTVDLLIKPSCFAKDYYSLSMKSNWSEIVRIRRSIVLILTLQKGFPVWMLHLSSVTAKHFK